jgi:hypothetical protein
MRSAIRGIALDNYDPVFRLFVGSHRHPALIDDRDDEPASPSAMDAPQPILQIVDQRVAAQLVLALQEASRKDGDPP